MTKALLNVGFHNDSLPFLSIAVRKKRQLDAFNYLCQTEKKLSVQTHSVKCKNFLSVVTLVTLCVDPNAVKLKGKE